MYYTYYIILRINTGRIISGNNTRAPFIVLTSEGSDPPPTPRRGADSPESPTMAATTVAVPDEQQPQRPVVPLNATLCAAAAVQRLDIAEMHEKVMGILATLNEGIGGQDRKEARGQVLQPLRCDS